MGVRQGLAGGPDRESPEGVDAKGSGGGLAKIQTVIARACLSGARPEYFSLLFCVSGPLFILPTSLSPLLPAPQPTAQPSFYPLCVQLVAPFSAIYPLAEGGLERIDRETVKYSVTIYIAKKRGRSDILVY